MVMDLFYQFQVNWFGGCGVINYLKKYGGASTPLLVFLVLDF
jgi:hypothetical protein